VPDVLKHIQTRAKSANRTIAVCDATDARILAAAKHAVDDEIARVILIGDRTLIEHAASEGNVNIRSIPILSAKSYAGLDALARSYYEARGKKIASIDLAREELLVSELLFAACLTTAGEVDGVLGGAVSTTGDVIRAALKGIGLAEGISVLSSFFLLDFPSIPGHREEFVLAFADAAVVPEPTAAQLADIAIATAANFETLTGEVARVAMLSFSTNGSAISASTEKVREALALARSKAPALAIDGEMQFDAAFVPEVAERKMSGSEVAGRANVFIFPNLDAGNIGYKIAERLGMGRAIGPILQGLKKPMNDLSRGARVSDIQNMVAVTALQSIDSGSSI
jgi:phosphate acetyltransferase